MYDYVLCMIILHNYYISLLLLYNYIILHNYYLSLLDYYHNHYDND